MIEGKVMTIQHFSVRTGLPPSTLRYYEKEGLILPSERGENGYRLYTEQQITIAITIHSLRLANVNLADIRQYLKSDKNEKVKWVHRWRKEIDAKLASLRVARQYLHGMEPDDEHIRLIKWDSPTRMVWFNHLVKRQLNPFSIVIEERATFLQHHMGIRVTDAFVRLGQIEGGEIHGKVGFRLSEHLELPEGWFNEAEVEVFEPTLFVTLECLVNDAFACLSMMLLLQSFGFDPAGPNMERYELCDSTSYQWMIPVVHGVEINNKTKNFES